jgi:D-glycero-D-manno-heptose 1,7-bisphosphate phosphatase
MFYDKQKAIFLDRDGIINQDVGYVYKVEEFKFVDKIFDACRHFDSLGFKLVIITNQSGIFREYYTQDDFLMLNDWMLKQFKNHGINILDIFFCPHGPDSNCLCRKPLPGMLLKALKKYNFEIKNSWLIGDKETDIQAANAAGITNTILLKNGHGLNAINTNAKYIIKSIEDTIEIIK